MDPQKFGFRFLKEEDIPIFCEWEKNERPYPWVAAHFKEALNSTAQRALVMENKKSILGFVVVQRISDEAYLINWMVNPFYRRQGWGRLILEKLFSWLHESGVPILMLDVDPLNTAALGLYKKAGFELVENRPKSYPGGEDSYLMRKKL